MQNQASQTHTHDQAARQNAQIGETGEQLKSPVELDLHQLQSVSGGTSASDAPKTGW